MIELIRSLSLKGEKGWVGNTNLYDNLSPVVLEATPSREALKPQWQTRDDATQICVLLSLQKHSFWKQTLLRNAQQGSAYQGDAGRKRKVVQNFLQW